MANQEQNSYTDQQTGIKYEQSKPGGVVGIFIDLFTGQSAGTEFIPDPPTDESVFPRESPSPARQLGFFLDPEQTGFSLRPRKGDEQIKPKRPKEKRKKGKTPYMEVLDFERMQADRADGTGEYIHETQDGGTIFESRSPHGPTLSRVGESDGDVVSSQFQGISKQPQLSPDGQRLYYARKNKAAGLGENKTSSGRKKSSSADSKRSGPEIRTSVYHQNPYPSTVDPCVRWDKWKKIIDALKAKGIIK